MGLKYGVVNDHKPFGRRLRALRVSALLLAAFIFVQFAPLLVPPPAHAWTQMEMRGSWNGWVDPAGPPFELKKQNDNAWFTIINIPRDMAASSSHTWKFANEAGVTWRGEGEVWGTRTQDSGATTNDLNNGAPADMTVSFTPGWYNIYNQNNDDNFSIGSAGRLLVDGKIYNIADSEAQKEWPNYTILGTDARNSDNDSFLLNYDTTFLYLGFGGFVQGSQDFFVYMDVDGEASGTDYIQPWNGDSTIHCLPFMADYALMVEGSGYKAVRNYTATGWNNPGDGGNIFREYVDNFSEFKIRWSDIGGVPAVFRVFAFDKWDSQGNIITSFPTYNPASNNSVAETIPYYYQWSINVKNDPTPRSDSTIRSGGVRINEVLWNATVGAEDYIELYNPRNYVLDISNYTIYDVETQDSYTFPTGTGMKRRSFVVFHPQKGTDYTDSFGGRHFYAKSNWDIGGSGTGDDSGGVELYRNPVLVDTNLLDFVTWSNNGTIANTGWDDTAVKLGIWTAGTAVDVLTGSANTDRPLIRRTDGADSDGVTVSEWVQIGPESTVLAGISNNADSGPSSITAIAFKDSDFSTDRTAYLQGETIYILITATNVSSGNTEATVAEIDGRGNLDVVAYENGVNSSSFRGILRSFPASSTTYSPAEDSIGLPSAASISVRSKTAPSVTDSALIDTVPYLTFASYNHKNKELSLYFTRPVDTSTIDTGKFAIQNDAAGGGIQNLSGASVKNGTDSNGVTLVLTTAQRNAIVLWEDSTLFVSISSSAGSGTSTLSLPTIDSTAARALDSYISGYDTAVKINEVYPQGDTSSDSAFIELYFLNSIEYGWIDIRNFYFAERADSRDFYMTASINLGPGDYFVIYRDTGTNAVNLTAAVADTGVYYSGVKFFTYTDFNQVALYNNRVTQDSSTILDYISWHRSNSSGGLSMPETQIAVSAGIWTSRDSFTYTAASDYSGSQQAIALKNNGADTNQSSDWIEQTYTPNRTNRINDPPTVSAVDIIQVSGKAEFLPGESYSIRIKYTDINGADSTVRFDFRIANNSDTIWYYSSAGQTPVAVEGSSYVVGTVSIDTSYTGNDVLCTWTLMVGWNFVDAANYVVGARATDNYPETGAWTDSTVNHVYDNDLVLSGTLAGTGASNGGVTSGAWFQANQTVTWSGLTVYFQNTTISPNVAFCTFAITDDDSRQTTQTGSAALSHDKLTDTAYDLSESVAVRLIDVPSPGTFDATTVAYSSVFKIDDSAPVIRVVDETYVFKADTNTRAPALKAQFLMMDSQTLLDTIQYQVGGTWFTLSSGDIETFNTPWFLSNAAYAKLDTSVINTVALRVYDQAGWATTANIQIIYEQITIDGSVADWQGDEKMQVDSYQNIWFMFAWDDTNVYFSYQPKSLEADGDGDFFVYFDVRPNTGSLTTIDWGGGGTHALPSDTGMRWDAAFCLDDNAGASRFEFQRDTGAGFTMIEDHTNFSGQTYIGWSGNGTTEVRMTWNMLTGGNGKPDSFNIVAFQQYESSNNMFTSYPTENPSAGSTGALDYAYRFPSSDDTVPPNSAIHSTINIDGGLAEWPDSTIIPAYRHSTVNADFRVTWDGAFMYFAFNRGDAFPNAANNFDVIQLYIDTTPSDNVDGSTTGISYSGSHTLPFKAQFGFEYAINKEGTGTDWQVLRKWTGAAFTDVAWTGAASKSTNAGVAEWSISFLDLGDTDPRPVNKMRFVLFTMEGSDAYLWCPSPTSNPRAVSPATLTGYIQYDSMPVAQTYPGAYYWTRTTVALPGADTKTGPFTPYIDGTKDPGWSSTPDTNSPYGAWPYDTHLGSVDDGRKFPAGRTDSIWITNDIANLYIGWYANGDHYDDANKNNSHYGFIFITDSYPAGTSYDPWKNDAAHPKSTRVYGYSADVWLEGYASYGVDNFSGMTLYKDNKGQWDTGHALTSGTDFKVSVKNYWGEVEVPLTTLNVKPGDTVGVMYYARHESDKTGISDITPHQPLAISDWSDADAAIDASKCKVYIIQYSSNATVAHKPAVEPVSGKGIMRSPFTPTSSEQATLTVSASPVGNYTHLYVLYSNNNWSTYDTLTLVSAYTSGTDEYFQAVLPAGFSRNDTVNYYILIDEALDNFVYGNDTLSYVTSNQATAKTNAFQFVVVNALPTVPETAVITPKVPQDGSTLQITASGSTDKDSDALFYVFTWYRNGGVVSELTSIDSTSPDTSSVSSDSTALGDNWFCDVTVGDGRDTSAAKRSNSVSISQFTTWSGTAPIEVNAAAVSETEWIWTDKTGDQRQSAASSAHFDLGEVRLKLDTTYLNFLIYLSSLTNANYPNIAISFDTDLQSGSGGTTLGDESVTNFGDSYELPAALFESLLVVHTYDLNVPIIEVLKNGVWSETTADVVIDTTAFIVQGRVLRSWLGLPAAGTVRCALASFKNRMGKSSLINSTVEMPVCDALDAVSISALNGTAANVNDKTKTIDAYDEDISDGDIDFWFQIRYDTFAGPLRNLRPLKVQNPTPSSGGTTTNLTPTFSWSMTSDTDSNDTVTSYLIEIGTSTNLEGDVEYRVNVDGSVTSFTPTSNLISDSYYWRVRARDRAGVLSDSTVWSFSVTTPTIGVSQPRDMNNVNNMNVYQDQESAWDTLYFQWAPATHSKSWKIKDYFIQISDAPTFDSIVVQDSLIGTAAQGCTTSYMIPAAYSLPRGRTYYARIKAGDTASPENWSSYSTPSDGILYSMRTTDGDSTDWAGTLGVARNNEAYIASTREGGWRDWLGDTRADNAANKNYLDLDEFRVASDSYNLYFYIRFNQWNDGSPYIQIALDVNQTSVRRSFRGRGVYAEDDYVNSTVAREYLIECRTGNDDVEVVNYDFTTLGYGRYKEKASDRSVELCVPLDLAGGLKEYTSDTANITAAIWWNDAGAIGQYTANNSNVVDAIAYNTFTWTEVSDNVIDYWLAVSFDTLSQVNGIKIETAAYTPPPTDPNPGTSYYGAFRNYITYNLFVDRFWDGNPNNPPPDPDMTGGDFQGIMDQMQYFCDLGINAFQLSPVCDYGWGAWGYNQSDLYRVQASYCTKNWNQWRGWDDYVRLAKSAAEHNITMGVDWIAGQIYGNNNSGGTISKNQKMWFDLNPDGRFGGRRILQYVSDVRQFFVDHTRYMYSLGTKIFRVDNPKFWPDPAEQGFPFFAYWNQQVKTFAPDLYSFGEVPGNASTEIGPFVRDGNRLTGCIDFGTGWDIKQWANDGTGEGGGGLRGTFDGNYAAYNGTVNPVMQLYYENHDHDRAYHELSDALTWDGSIGDMQSVMMFMATAPGVPSIYYGDERVMMGKKGYTYPGWQPTTSTGAGGGTRAFAWDYSGATGAIQATVSYALKARQAFPALRYDQGSIYWLQNDGGHPLSYRRGSGTGEEVLVLINPNDAGYTFNGVNTSAATTWYKDWFTDGEVQSDGSANFNFGVAANYAAFLKRNRFGRATVNVTVRNNSGRLTKAIVSVDRTAAYTKETNANGQCTISDIVTAKSSTTNRQLRIWYPGYNAYDVTWIFTDGVTLTFDINMDTHGSAGVDVTSPSSPFGLTAAARNHSVVLDWADNTEGDIESYYIYRSTTPNDVNATMIMEVINSTFFDNNFDDKLDNYKTYYYKVRARDYNNHLSGFSDEIAVTPNLTPVKFQVDMTGSGFNVTTMYMKGNAYNLGRFDFNQTYVMADIDPLVKMDYIGRNIWEKTVYLDPTMNINYLYVCNHNNGTQWYNEYGFSNNYAYENARGFTIPASSGDTFPLVRLWMTGGDAAPQAPQGLTAVGQNSTIKLGWSLNLEADVNRYELWRSTDDVTYNVVSNVDQGVINYTDNNITNGTTYYYKMKAADVANNFSAFSSTVSTKPTTSADTVAPAHPSGVVSQNGGLNTVVFKWNYNTEGDLAGYNVYRNTSANFALSAANKLNIAPIAATLSPQWIDSTAQAGTQYYYAVTAVDDFNNQSDSSTVLGVKLARLTFHVDMGNINTAGNVIITANDHYVTWTGKNMSDSGPFTWIYTTDFIVGSALQYKYGTTDTVEQDFATTSRNRELTIADNPSQTFEDDWQEFPDAVTGLTGTPDSGAAWLFWTANTADKDLDGYNVYKQEATGGFTKMNSSVIRGTTKYKVTGLTNGTTYSFAARAIDSGTLTLESPNSNTVNITPGGYVYVDFRN